MDTIGEIPPAPTIFWATTKTAFNDGRYGSRPTARIEADMEYFGNRGSHEISYSIVGDEPDIQGRVYDEQNQTYSPFGRHRFTRPVYVETHKNCGLNINANTTHQAWWSVWLPFAPTWQSPRPTRVSRADRLQTELCPAPEEEEEEPPPEDPGDGSGSGGGGYSGWIDIETCHYWAHYVNGVLVSIELRYCEYDIIPIADE